MLKKLLVFGLVVGCGQVAWGQSDKGFITFEGTATETVTFLVESSNPPDSPPDLPAALTLPASPGMDALAVRNAGVPEVGLGPGGYIRLRFKGKPATLLGGVINRVWWVSNDGGASWHLLEPSVPVTLSGITFTNDSYLTSDPVTQAQGNVPAVGGLGLLVIAASMIGAGAWVMRKRANIAVAVVALLVVGASESARAERHIGMRKTSSGAVREGTFSIGKSSVGTTTVQTVFAAMIDSEESEETLRDRMVPPHGIAAVGKRGDTTRPTDGLLWTGIQVPDTDDVQFWASVDGGDWVIIVPNNITERIVGDQQHFLNVKFTDIGSNGWTAQSPVPAVGTWGLTVMVLMIVVGGTMVLRQRRIAE